MQVSEHVHAIKIPFQINIAPGVVLDRFAFAYLVVAGRITLIDSGVAGGEGLIFDYLRSIGRDPGEIDLLVLTHSHPDHVGAAQTIREATSCRVAAHPAERDWIEDVDLQARQRPVPGFADLVAGSVPVDRELRDGETLPLGEGLCADVLHTPGHSRGSISLWLRAEGVLICGDAVALPGDLPIYDDVAAAVGSIRRLQAVEGVRVLLSAWEPPVPAGQVAQRLEKALAYLQRIHEAVLAAAADEAAPEPMDLCRRVVAAMGAPPVAANPLVARSLMSHLRVRDRKSLL